MALQHLRSNTANKRPTAGAMSDGQIAVNTNATSPGLFFKDAGGAIIKVGPVHVGTTAPNSSPASGGSTGNSTGEVWLDTSGGTYVFKVWDGSQWQADSAVRPGDDISTHDIDVSGRYVSGVTAVSALDIDCASGNYFTKTINANSTFTFSNVPASGSFSFTLELTHTSGTVTWPGSVKFPSDTAPTLTTGKTHLFMFVTDDGGTRFRGASLVNYVN